MTQCVRKRLSDSMGINQGYLPASKKIIFISVVMNSQFQG